MQYSSKAYQPSLCLSFRLFSHRSDVILSYLETLLVESKIEKVP